MGKERRLTWIELNERLPEIGRFVYVQGLYTVPHENPPVARRIECGFADGGWRWSSDRWIGCTGVTHWSETEVFPSHLPQEVTVRISTEDDRY